jgi:lipopolysaccharide transport system ATP-binding protein
MTIAIKIENLSKQYRLGLVSTRTLSHDLNRWYQMNVRGKEDPYLKIGETNILSSSPGGGGREEAIWALRDINLEVEQGEVLGIIGKNGAGKSTLLKILSKVTAPTTGTISARGRIASLLEVGTGFHPEMTGRENIFMNGAIMGMTKTEIRRKFDEIVDFAGVERYIDTPVKRYSSGMTVRLGFAVAAHLDPEILVVDEVLAVGDAEFQKKAIGKMQDISKGEGRTILFVSHNMTAVENICNRLVILHNGLLKFYGNVDNGIKVYLNSVRDNKIFKAQSTDYLYKDDFITLFNISLLQNELTDNFSTREPIEMKFHYEVNKKIIGFRVGFDLIDNESGIVIFRSFHDEDAEDLIDTYPGIYESMAEIPAFLLKDGVYKISISIGIHSIKWLIHDFIKYVFTVYNIGGINKIYADQRPGLIMPKIHWENKICSYGNGE